MSGKFLLARYVGQLSCTTFFTPFGVAGPVLSRFERFLLIGPRATRTNQHKFTLSIKAACV